MTACAPNLAYAWRVLTTGITFLLFLAGGTILTMTALPVILAFSRTEEQKQRLARALIHRTFKLLMAYLQRMTLIGSFKVEGLDQLHSTKGKIFVANHPTLMDVVAILTCLPDCQCLVKASLLRRFYIGGLMRAAGYLGNDHPEQVLANGGRILRDGRSLLIFPEGTRSPLGGLHSFSRSAAQIALRLRAPIVPIVVTCEPATLSKHEPWYAIPERPPDFRLCVLPQLPIPPAGLNQKALPLQARALTMHLEQVFQARLKLSA